MYGAVFHVFFYETKFYGADSKTFSVTPRPAQGHFDFVAISQRSNYVFVLQIYKNINFII